MLKVHLLSQSQPIPYNNKDVVNTYTKDGLFCIYLKNGDVHKYPLCGIFRIIETYDNTQSEK